MKGTPAYQMLSHPTKVDSTQIYILIAEPADVVLLMYIYLQKLRISFTVLEKVIINLSFHFV